MLMFTVTVTSGAESRIQLQEAEAALQSFRHVLRADLRGSVSNDNLTKEVVDLLKTRLDAVRDEVNAALKG